MSLFTYFIIWCKLIFDKKYSMVSVSVYEIKTEKLSINQGNQILILTFVHCLKHLESVLVSCNSSANLFFSIDSFCNI